MLKRIAVVWNQAIVGFINDLKSDHFELYGAWEPCHSALYQDFIEFVGRGDEPWVQIGDNQSSAMGTVTQIVDLKIEVKIRKFPSGGGVR